MFASVGAGETNGIYYPLGDVICGIVNQNLHESGIRCSREMTPGSVYNVEALRDGELEFALVQSDVAYDAYHGTGAYTEAPFPGSSLRAGAPFGARDNRRAGRDT
jgi:uncharacterized protein